MMLCDSIWNSVMNHLVGFTMIKRRIIMTHRKNIMMIIRIAILANQRNLNLIEMYHSFLIISSTATLNITLIEMMTMTMIVFILLIT